MMLDFGRAVCGELAVARRREWLVTNGRGAFAMGTVAGVMTRRYHGLLIGALAPPLGRTLLLTKLDETARYDGGEYELFVNHWTNDVIEPDGYQYLERFFLDGTTPVWHYACGDALLEKRLWLAPGENIVYVRYTLLRASGGPLTLEMKAFFNYRDYHRTTIVNDWAPDVIEHGDGLKITMFDSATPLYFQAPGAELYPQFDWYEDFLLSEEEYRGQDDVVEDHLYLAFVRARLAVGQSVTVIAGTVADPSSATAAWAARVDHEAALLKHVDSGDEVVRRLVLAADQFVVEREAPGEGDGRSLIAGYPWFSDWGRDTMIALPGLTLETGRADVAARILRTYAHFVDDGMLPNRFPDAGEEPEYNTIDASLWYFEAIRAYHAATGDDALVRDLFPTLADIIDWHRRGTRYNIHMSDDGLLFGGEDGVQLTWMDAKVGDWVVTPRIGKPVEVNALWYNALRVMVDFAALVGEDDGQYTSLAERSRRGFERFWRDDGYCSDVIDGPDGDDDALRPNQLLAVSLLHSPLAPEQQRMVVDQCARQLLTSHGLRSLAPGAEGYEGEYGGNARKRDGAYHQGTVWAWLLGPFVTAHYRVYGDREAARSFLRPMIHHLDAHGVGSISEIFDGDPPFEPRGCPAQAWSVAELLRAWRLTAE